MRLFIHIASLVFLCAVILAGCDRPHTLSPFKWPAVGETFDSVTTKLETLFHEYAPYDTIDHYQKMLEDMARASHGDDSCVKMSRALYWKARFATRLEQKDSAIKMLRHALTLNDSNKYYYDRLRIKSLLYITDDNADYVTQFRHFEEAIAYCKKHGDMAYEAYSDIVLGNLLENIGEYDKSLYYLNRSDSLNRLLGFNKLPVKNTINRARVYESRGDKETADSLLMSIIGHPALSRDVYTQNVIPRNLFVSTREKKYLLQAHDEIKDRDNFRYLRGLYRGLLSEINFNEGNLDSCVQYARLAVEDLQYVKEYGHRAIIWFNMGLAWNIEGRLDSSLMCRIRYEMYVDSSRSVQRATEVMRLSAMHELNTKEAEYTASLYRRNIVIIIMVVLIIVAGVVAVFMVGRHRMHQRINEMERQLDLEKTKRKMAATALTIEEKDKMLGHVRSSLSEMREEGIIKESSARVLESSIKTHLIEHENDDVFQDMFDSVNPKFTSNLRERCPDLADNYIRLACYILMELDNKRIASLMMIKPESVRQARWRLSQRLNLPKGTTLESFLRSLNSVMESSASTY